MKKVSIIVPVYNVEKYLRRCLNSLVNQTLTDIEVILVNDGSKDKSQEIINEFKEKFNVLLEDVYDIDDLVRDGYLIKENNYLKINKKYMLFEKLILIYRQCVVQFLV